MILMREKHWKKSKIKISFYKMQRDQCSKMFGQITSIVNDKKNVNKKNDKDKCFFFVMADTVYEHGLSCDGIWWVFW